jgi:hypothetical protein
MEYFVVGQVVRLTHTVYNDAGALTNPATITVTITLPDGTSSGPLTPANTGTGLYKYDYTTVQAGRHVYWWTSTSPTAPDDGMFYVHATTVGIVSLGDAKSHLNKATGSAPDDEELRGFIEYATEKVQDWTGVTYARQTFTAERHSVAYGTSDVELYHGPIVAVTSIVSADGTVTWTPGNFSPDGRWLRRSSGTYLYGDVLFTYTAATSVIPAKAIYAAKEIIRRAWNNTQRQPGLGPSPFGGEGAEPLPSRVTDALLEEILGPRPPMVA